MKILPSSVVYDVMKARGLDRCVLPSGIRPLNAHTRITGRAFTISGHETLTLSADETLLRWSTMLSSIPGDTVAVCQPNTHAIALMGELSANALKLKGVRGYICDAGCRDVTQVEECGLPVYCTHFTPRDVVGRWTWDKLGEPIVIGEVSIATGDLIVGDRDGVVVVPQSIADAVIMEANAVLSTESDMRKEILNGTDPKEAYLIHRKF
jgi:regulator of RNase E activity RraA